MVTAYPVKGKQKSYEICRAFAEGCGGFVTSNANDLKDGAAFFYGVDESNLHIWNRVRKERRDFYYCDNAYFDQTRQEYFRVSKNRLQHSGTGVSDCRRFNELDIYVKPWRREGRHLVVCPQSDHFMNVVVGYNGNWTQDTLSDLSRLTLRSIRLRLWSPDKGKLANTLKEDLNGAHALITWSSAAAITAIIEGVPAIVMGESAASLIAAIRLEDLEYAPRLDRTNWLGVLADNQWTLDEMRSGFCWKVINAS